MASVHGVGIGDVKLDAVNQHRLYDRRPETHDTHRHVIVDAVVPRRRMLTEDRPAAVNGSSRHSPEFRQGV